MKKAYTLLLTALTLGTLAQAQNHITTIYDSTSVSMEESGLSHVINHQRIRANDYQGCAQIANIKVDYDPQSAYVEFREAKIYRNGSTSPEPVAIDNVKDYVAPARLIYWGASQKLLLVGHLNPGDEVEYTTYRKGFTYALLATDDDSRYIPPMRGHFYDIVPFWADHQVLQKVYQLDILKSKNIKFKVYNGTLSIDSTDHGERIIYTFAKSNIEPIEHEQGMVANNDIECKLLLSTAQNWEAKSRWFYGVNESYGSFKSTPELQSMVNELLESATTELDSISILTHWVADNMRYCGISMGEGEGFTLHNAQMNFTDRCGVCKDKASLLIAMLRAAGFEAYAAMTMAHERIDDIPADQFNHSVAVVKRHDGTLQPLDPTWVPNVRELWSSAEQQQGYLPGTPQGTTLQVTPLSPAQDHYIKINCTSQITKEGTLIAHLVITAEGQSDKAVRGVFNARKSEWIRNLETEILRIEPSAFISSINTTDPERYLEQPVTIVYDFTVPDYAIVDGREITFIPFSARNIYSRAMGHLGFDTRIEHRNYGFADNCSRLVEISEIINLPKGFKKAQLPEANSTQGHAADYDVNYAIDGHSILFNETLTFNKRVYEASDWEAFRQTVNTQKEAALRYITITK